MTMMYYKISGATIMLNCNRQSLRRAAFSIKATNANALFKCIFLCWTTTFLTQCDEAGFVSPGDLLTFPCKAEFYLDDLSSDGKYIKSTPSLADSIVLFSAWQIPDCMTIKSSKLDIKANTLKLPSGANYYSFVEGFLITGEVSAIVSEKCKSGTYEVSLYLPYLSKIAKQINAIPLFYGHWIKDTDIYPSNASIDVTVFSTQAEKANAILLNRIFTYGVFGVIVFYFYIKGKKKNK